jgi:predicted nucleic acid-binding protein
MGRVARRLELLDLVWSEQLLDEAKQKLVDRKGLDDRVAERWVGYLRENFPAGATNIDDATNGIELAELTIDPDDEHVCALAIAGRASYLFTHDRGYLDDALKSYGVEVARPDQFLTGVFAEQPQAVVELLELQTSAWAGGRAIDELLAAIERAGAGRFVTHVRCWLDDQPATE